ncbi:hypothetical protein DY000_02016554 [Brassica cretica]|uniref:Glucose-methanol-choline oxidoreductase C-terminal domain-containing protein n=1 Tax=Brassica cretica TaxID=69181 RepID=A0ABQ7DA09_BRACR|nr:hypothetical protein DY000_02016554 [Brassica cretica]
MSDPCCRLQAIWLPLVSESESQRVSVSLPRDGEDAASLSTQSTIEFFKSIDGLILQKVDGPLSRGHLELRNTNPNDNPSVTFNYYQDPENLKICVKGLKTIIEVINSNAFFNYKYTNATAHELFNLMLDIPTNLRPRHVTSALNLTQFCIDTVMTIWHYHGGCQVGRVVDKNYKVLGIDALRVIDGSTFLKSPGTNLQATVMMLGRYMGQRILRERDEVGEKNEEDLSVSPIEDETNLCSSFPKNKL